MAGVVNIILKKSYIGTEVGGEFGVSQQDDGKINHFTGITGFGDLGADGYNGFVSVGIPASGQHPSVESERHLERGQPGAVDEPGDGHQQPDTRHSEFPQWWKSGKFELGDRSTGESRNGGDRRHAGILVFARVHSDPAASRALRVPVPGAGSQPSTQNLNVLGRFTFNFGGGWQSATALSMFNSQAEQTEPFNPSSNGSTNYPGGMLAYRGGPGVTPVPVPGFPPSSRFPRTTREIRTAWRRPSSIPSRTLAIR